MFPLFRFLSSIIVGVPAGTVVKTTRGLPDLTFTQFALQPVVSFLLLGISS